MKSFIFNSEIQMKKWKSVQKGKGEIKEKIEGSVIRKQLKIHKFVICKALDQCAKRSNDLAYKDTHTETHTDTQSKWCLKEMHFKRRRRRRTTTKSRLNKLRYEKLRYPFNLQFRFELLDELVTLFGVSMSSNQSNRKKEFEITETFPWVLQKSKRTITTISWSLSCSKSFLFLSFLFPNKRKWIFFLSVNLNKNESDWSK